MVDGSTETRGCANVNIVDNAVGNNGIQVVCENLNAWNWLRGKQKRTAGKRQCGGWACASLNCWCNVLPPRIPSKDSANHGNHWKSSCTCRSSRPVPPTLDENIDKHFIPTFATRADLICRATQRSVPVGLMSLWVWLTPQVFRNARVSRLRSA